MKAATPQEIAEARAILAGRDIKGVSARSLVQSSKELGKSLSETLNYLSRLLEGGQGQGPAPSVTKDVDRLKPQSAIGGEPVEYATAKGVTE